MLLVAIYMTSHEHHCNQHNTSILRPLKIISILSVVRGFSFKGRPRLDAHLFELGPPLLLR